MRRQQPPHQTFFARLLEELGLCAIRQRAHHGVNLARGGRTEQVAMDKGGVRTIQKIFQARIHRRVKTRFHHEAGPTGFMQMREGQWCGVQFVFVDCYPHKTILLLCMVAAYRVRTRCTRRQRRHVTDTPIRAVRPAVVGAMQNAVL